MHSWRLSQRPRWMKELNVKSHEFSPLLDQYSSSNQDNLWTTSVGNMCVQRVHFRCFLCRTLMLIFGRIFPDGLNAWIIAFREPHHLSRSLSTSDSRTRSRPPWRNAVVKVTCHCWCIALGTHLAVSAFYAFSKFCLLFINVATPQTCPLVMPFLVSKGSHSSFMISENRQFNKTKYYIRIT